MIKKDEVILIELKSKLFGLMALTSKIGVKYQRKSRDGML